jgi:hypothetical protein
MLVGDSCVRYGVCSFHLAFIYLKLNALRMGSIDRVASANSQPPRRSST